MTKDKQTNQFKEGIFNFRGCIVIVAIENGMYHLSISKANEHPSYEDIKQARYNFTPDSVVMAQIFPPKSQFVNLHEHCFHLWEVGRYDKEKLNNHKSNDTI